MERYGMYRIGVISDTHGLLREEVIKELQSCDIILHGGDIDTKDIIEKLKNIAPFYVVRGNVDKEWAEYLPKMLEIELYGIHIKMIHNRKELPKNLGVTDLIVFGHSHKYTDQMENGIRWLNPGSCGLKRFYYPITMAVIEVMENGRYEIRRIDISHEQHEQKEKNLKMPEKEQDRQKIVKAVMKDVDRGKTVKQIAESNHISLELTEQICRMYLTHPGVDIDGILNRIS
jgi:putative phosphoesterase